MRRLPLLALLLPACSGATTPDRDAILLEWLQRDNAIWLNRDPRLLPGKYQRMANDIDGDGVGDDPYNFMRGTAGLFYEDLQRRSLDRVDLGYGRSPEAASVWIVGDPHPENLSTFLPLDEAGPQPGQATPPLKVEWADMDAAAYGPWIADVRRGAQGLMLFLQGFDGCDDPCQAQAARQYGDGYDTTLRAVAAGEATVLLTSDLLSNPFVGDLLDEAASEGDERKRLSEHTETVDDRRQFLTLPRFPFGGRGYLPPTPTEQLVVDRILERHAVAEEARTERPFRVLAVARRVGQGVSSWPATRFVVLWDTGGDSEDDDRLLNMREVLDTPIYPGPGVPASAPWASNADRLLTASRALWSQPDLDPRLGALTDGPTSWKLLSYTSWYQGLDHNKAAEVWTDGDADQADVDTFARGLGAALALAHARTTTASGTPALDAILQDLGDDPERLGTALQTVAFIDRDRTLDDYARFVRLLDEQGELLGADQYAEIP